MGIKVDSTTLDPQTNLQVPASTGRGIVVDDVNSVYIPQTLFFDSMNFTDVYTDPLSKYTEYNVTPTRFTDWDESRARNQSTGEKWSRGLAKAGVTTVGAIAENTIGVLFGLGEIATGGSYYDNWVGKTIDKGNDWMRETLPNYMTQAEQEYSTLQKLGTANFWADTVANGFGYSLGSIATIALTGGVGLLAKGASLAAKGARAMSIYNMSKNIANATKVAQQIGKPAKFLGTTAKGFQKGLQVAEVGVMMSLAEASVEARETQRNTYEDLLQKVIEDPDNNINSIEDLTTNQLQEIEHASYAAGNRNFLTQLPILAGTNLLMFGKAVAGFKASNRVNKDVLFDQGAFKAVSALEGRSKLRNTLSRLKPTGAGMVTEAGQEGWQFASNIYSTDYHTNKYFNSGNADLVGSMFKGVEDTFGTQEGLESMLVGAIVGGGMAGVRSTVRRDFNERKNQAKYAADLINGGYFANTADKTLNSNAAILMVKEMEAARQTGDIKRFKDAQYKFIQYQALNSLDHGTFDVFTQKLEDSKSLSDEEFAKLFGFDMDKSIQEQTKTDSNPEGKTKSKVIDDIKNKLEEFSNTYERVNELFPPSMKSTPVARMLMSKDERDAEDSVEGKRNILRKELILNASGITERNRRLETIHRQMQSILGEAGKINGVPMIDNDFNLHTLLTEPAPETLGDVDAKKRVKTTKEKLNDVYKKLQQKQNELNDANAGAAVKPFEQAARDYLSILDENLTAVESYNKLMSDEYFQDLFTENIKAQEDIAKRRAEEAKAKETIDEAKEAKDVKVPEDSPQEVKNVADIKRRKLKTAEEKAKKFWLNRVEKYKTIDEKLADLKAIDPKGIETDAKRAGLAAAIEVLENTKKGNKKNIPEAGNPEEEVVASMDLETTTEENVQVVEQVSLEENEDEEEALTINDSNILLADNKEKTQDKVPPKRKIPGQLELDLDAPVQEAPTDKNVSNEQLEIQLATNTTGVIITENLDGTQKWSIPIDSEGAVVEPDSDTLEDKDIPINEDLLLNDDIIGVEVEFEIIENDWWKSGEGRRLSEDWMEIPIYVKIGDEYIGKLSASESNERKAILDKLQKGEKVTTNISSIRTNNFNNALNEDTNERVFNDPRKVFGKDDDVLLVFTEVDFETGTPSYTLGEVDPAKDKGDLSKIRANVENMQDVQVDQIGVVIRSKHNQQPIDRVAFVSTANLSSTAQLKVLDLLEKRNFGAASEIVASSEIRKGANNNSAFLEFGKFADKVDPKTGEIIKEGEQYIVYYSPKLQKLVRINEIELVKAFRGQDNVYFNEVEVNQDEKYVVTKKATTKYSELNDIKADLAERLELKKYNVKRENANLNTPYTSPVHPQNKYDTYQEYLFDEREIGGDRVEGQGHNSIVATDLVKKGERLFNNPEVKFGKGNLLGETAPEIIKNTKIAPEDYEPGGEQLDLLYGKAPVAPTQQMEKDLNRLGVKQSKGNLSKKELSEKAKEYGMSVKDFKLEINKWHLNYNIRFEIAELENETLVQSRFLESGDKQTTINEIIGYMRKSPERYQKELPFQDITLETTMKAMMVAPTAPVAPAAKKIKTIKKSDNNQVNDLFDNLGGIDPVTGKPRICD